MKPLTVLPEPCSSCPYRRDTPPGVWDRTEYEKLRRFDEGAENPDFATFLCHHTTADNEICCRGWLAVHRESVAVRLTMLKGATTPDQVYADVKTPLYATGNEAADAGIAGIEEPSLEARKTIQKVRKSVNKRKRESCPRRSARTSTGSTGDPPNENQPKPKRSQSRRSK